MKILIAGSAGFIGSNLTNDLLQHTAHTVIGLDDLAGTPDLDNLQPSMAHPRHKFYLGDIHSYVMLKLFELEKPDLVINASRSYTRSMAPMVGYMMKTDQMLFGLAKNNGVKRYLSLSAHADPIPDEIRTNVRLCEVFGIRQNPKEIIPSQIYKYLNNPQAEQDLTDDQPKEWIYIRDLIGILTNIIGTDKLEQEIYLGSGQLATAADISNYIKAIILGTHQQADLKQAQEDTIGIQTAKTFGHPTVRPLGASIEHTLNWFNMNGWAFKGI